MRLGLSAAPSCQLEATPACVCQQVSWNRLHGPDTPGSLGMTASPRSQPRVCGTPPQDQDEWLLWALEEVKRM